MAMTRLTGSVADYSWGGLGSLSNLLGWSATDAREAEWWLGTHPLRPSRVESGQLLSEWLAAQHQPEELPFLFKVLSPTAPLSLQVHPSAEQAREGFAREEEEGIPLDAPTRLYKDPHPKPELVVAIGGPFHALAGIRPVEATIEHLEVLVGDEESPVIRGWMEKLSSWNPAEIVGWLLSDSAEVGTLMAELGELADRDDTLSRLHRHYPGDPGIAVGLMMHRLTLLPGEAAFLDAGQLHAYLEGFAIELMAPSDNVLRGGLTPKHVDVEELMVVAQLDPVERPTLEPVLSAEGGVVYRPDGHDLNLALLEGTEVSARKALSSPVLIVATDGEWQVSDGSDTLTLGRGEACVVVNDGAELLVRGSGQIWWAFA
jgi:mannose-6-phosphate isomerase